MEYKTFTEDELNSFSKEMIVTLYLQMASSFQLLSQQNEMIMKQNEEALKLNEQQLKQIEKLQEDIAILTNYRFGRRTERTADVMDGQLSFEFGDTTLIFNEAEVIYDSRPEEEKSEEELQHEFEEWKNSKKRKKGQREADLRKADVEVEDYKIDEEELNRLFPEGYVELPSRVSHRVEYIPAKVKVYQEVIHQYKSKDGTRFQTADHPRHLLHHGIVTPSLAAKVICDKYINAIPVNRISREFGWLDIIIRPATISRWMINLTDKYLLMIYKRMMEKIKAARLIHCDETPFVCVEDENTKSYMWVYHTTSQYGSPPIFIYQYSDNRRTENVDKFMKGYKGIIMADGYEPYHTVARKSDGDIVVAGCYAHAKRKFMDVIKTDPKNAIGTIAFEGNQRIAEIYHVDNKMKDATEDERLKYRQKEVKPLVDNFFDWAKDVIDKTGTEHTRRALQYCINQEPYLREFLNSGIIPLDNSDAERSIKSFCVGKHSWHFASSSRGASTSGILYSIAETAKANKLKPYEYFKYIFEYLLKNEGKITTETLEEIMPWSEALPEDIRDKKKD